MKDTLFDILETKSPRLLWMERNHITIKSGYNHDDEEPIYQALHGMEVAGEGLTEDDAIVNLAKKLNLKLWNEI
jgi:hypothetical protein